MITGMTGFGSRSFSYKGRRFVVNIRSVNHKFLDFVINLPDGFFNLETRIKKELSGPLNRGRTTFQLMSIDQPKRKPILDEGLLLDYFRLIKDIGRSLKIKQEIGLVDIINLPGIIYLRGVDECLNKIFLSGFYKTMKRALEDLVLLRKKEGKQIYLDFTRQTQAISQRLKSIKARLDKIIGFQKTKLSPDELKDFLKDYNVEEEIKRLEFHIITFKQTMAKAAPVGKVLDFITQEMQREINTLSAKFRDSRVSYLSVLIKDEIEKIREQLQNVE